MEWISILAIVFSIILIGFLSGIELVFLSANKLSLELNKKKGTFSGKTWGGFSERPTKFISTILVSLTFLMIIYGLLIGDFLFPVWEWIEKKLPAAANSYVKVIRLLVETFLSTAIILTVDFAGRALFKAKSSNMLSLNSIAYIAYFFYWLLGSITQIMVAMGEWILVYIFNIKLSKKKEAFSKIDIDHLIQKNKTMEEEDSSSINKELFENALNIGERKIRECLIPRKEIEGIESSSSIDTVKAKFEETKLSKIVVYDKDIDNITGYVHHLDMFKKPSTINEILHPIPTVPETMLAIDLMNKFSKERKSIAWVIDEFGGTAGIVTMEDLLEEIFGEIEDEYDVAETFVDKQIAQNEYIFSGRLELDFITKKYRLKFAGVNGAETLSGYIIQNNEAIPKQKQRIIIGNFEFDILNVNETRIETIKLKVLK
jgi:putative hemolysin